ncbi:FMN-binding glutamate synthase family protein [Autumnicola psychrophila]|uniref:FMN-binding glutamate synthase family protein n=1 Tax=Autumnicola psychrophila TaxID=3075592 RepID=A0ABU3DTJ5_9FLAO|nr:FMN-binding glutamate synthase family protein [Zunongwangia sp. F225]MDT0687047.1 FMN-binding glutamate synthase family protein [Zunongwangia sp. F225]
MNGILDFLGSISWWGWILIFLVLIAIKDIFFNKTHIIKHNFPVVGNLRYLLESIGPELRQYIVASNREELPFNRGERGWIYASSKNENNYEGFGTDRDIYGNHYIFVNNALMPFRMDKDHHNHKDPTFIACAKVMGLYHKRRRPFRPASIINVSAMSFGSLSARAIESLNRGCKKAAAFHNTGEGGLSNYHKTGADVVYQIGTAYFGVRDDNGNFCLEKLVALVDENPQIRAIEIKLSQGAKPGKGGVLPASKITQEIADIRHIPVGKDVLSPPNHTAFGNTEELVEFIEKIAEATGLPVGIKSAVGQLKQWEELADIMQETGTGPDFISIDGGEGGTGAAPPSFADHVSLPFIYAFSDVYRIFLKQGITDRIVFIASGKLGFPGKAAMAMALGADCISVAREAMLSIGCIQAQVCHNNTCPSGVATQNKWLQSGINIKDKSERVNYYFTKFRKELLEITHACGYEHPCQIDMSDVQINLSDKTLVATLEVTFCYQKSKVDFTSVQEHVDSPYLGGKTKAKEVTTKEAETEDTSVYDKNKRTKTEDKA